MPPTGLKYIWGAIPPPKYAKELYIPDSRGVGDRKHRGAAVAKISLEIGYDLAKEHAVTLQRNLRACFNNLPAGPSCGSPNFGD